MRIILIIISFIAVSGVQAQQNNTLFLMHDLPQANIVNPSVPINCKFYMGLPIVGSTHFNAYSTGFAFNDIFESYAEDSLRFDPENAINKFDKFEILAAEFHLALMSLGYQYEKNYFTFSINEKFTTYNIASKNAVLFAYKGNSQFEGERVDMGGVRVNANHYREFALGWARELNDKFNFGARVKLLFGKGNVYTKNTEMSLYTDGETFDLELKAEGDLYISFPITVTLDENGEKDEADFQEDIDWFDYAMNKENKGLGVDIGFTYQINENTTLSGSLLDIGFINWKTDAFNFYTEPDVLSLSGDTYANEVDDIGDIFDTLTAVFDPLVYEGSYAAPLVPAIYLGASSVLNSWFDVGAVFHIEMYKKKWHPSLTFSGNTALIRGVFASASYTIQNKQFNNLGLGIGAKVGVVQFHAVSDNVTGFLNLASTRNVNLRFGMALLFGCSERNKRNKKDSGIRALPCFGDPYNAVKSRKR